MLNFLRVMGDFLIVITFWGGSFLVAKEAYEFFRQETIFELRKGLSSTYEFTRKMTRKEFDWEKEDRKPRNRKEPHAKRKK
jgi:hypothetical protein